MGLDILENILSGVLSSVMGSFDMALNGIVDMALNMKPNLGSYVGKDLTGLFNSIRMFGIYLIILKFLKKGFDVYILWTDGDAELDPFVLLTNFFKAIIIAITFDTLYTILVDVSKDMIDTLLGTMNTVGVDINWVTIIPRLLNKGIAMLIAAIVFAIMYFILWIKFITKGLELLILNAGIPIAAVGLLDSDGGVFKPYIKKIFQEVFTIMIQVIMLKFALLSMVNGHYLVGIAAMMMALKAPQFLSEFIMASTGGGAVQKVTSAMYMTSMVKGFVK